MGFAGKATYKTHMLKQYTGPVATSIKNEAGTTASEFSDLASSRQTPAYTAANDTPLTRTHLMSLINGNGSVPDILTDYHSFFYTLLSVSVPHPMLRVPTDILQWKNKRATGITFASVVAFIFACRYLPIIRYLIKCTWMVLGGSCCAHLVE